MSQDEVADLAAEAERDLQGYNSAFIRANHEDNPSLMRPWLRLPVTRFGNAPGSATTASTPEEADAMWGRMVDGLKGTGYERSILDNFEVSLINRSTALIRCHGVRERADGSVILEFDTAYILARGDDRWQVSALISQQP